MNYTFDSRLDFTLFNKECGAAACPAHFHTYSQIVLPFTEGVGVRIGQSDPVELPVDSVLFLSPFVHRHIDGNVQGAIWDTLAVNLYRMGPSFINSPYLGEIHSLYRDGFAGILYRGEVAQQVRTLFERLENSFSIEHMLGVLSILHLLSQSDGWPLTPAEVHPMDRREIELCVSIDDYVNNHIDTPIDIASVAARIHMSTASFCRFFRRYFGMSFHAWLLDKKIETACYQLHVGTAPIQDIADRLGFHSASHFSMTFKRRMGITPGEYRRTARPGAQRQ